MAAVKASHAEVAQNLEDIEGRLHRAKGTIIDLVFPHTARKGQRAELTKLVEQASEDLSYLAQVVREAGEEYGDGEKPEKVKAEVKPAQPKAARKPTATKKKGVGKTAGAKA